MTTASTEAIAEVSSMVQKYIKEKCSIVHLSFVFQHPMLALVAFTGFSAFKLCQFSKSHFELVVGDRKEC